MAFVFGSCPECHRVLPESFARSSSGGPAPCPQCRNPTQLVLFPVLKTPRKKGRQPELLLQSGESGCLFHSGNKASAICGSCGAFICPLCEIHLQSEPICPACLERQTRSGKSSLLKKTHYLWDNISLALSVAVPVTFVFWFLSLFTAPCALFLALYHWKGSGVLRKPSKIRLGFAIFISLAQIAGWILLFLYLFNVFSKLPMSK